MSTLEPDHIARAVAELDGWSVDDAALVRKLRFPRFRDAIDFIGRVAELADALNHHPELWNSCTRVEVRLTSHDAGGITQRDLDLAAAIDEVVGEAEPAD